MSDKLDSDAYEVRRIPYDIGNKFPFYISFGTYKDKFIQYEFFRIDTTRYYVREYFRGDFPPGEIVRSFGEEMVAKKVSDTVLFDLFDPVCGDKTPSYLAAEQRLIKDGIWTEFENYSASPTLWRGDYRNNKKTGVWSRLLSFDQDTVLIGQIDYQKDSAKVNGNNSIREKSLSDLKELLQGEWLGISFSPEGSVRYFKDADTNYYRYSPRCYFYFNRVEFNKSGRFIKQLANGYENDSKALSRGTWRLRRNSDRTFVDLVYNDETKWELELLYYNPKEGLFMNLNKYPQPSK